MRLIRGALAAGLGLLAAGCGSPDAGGYDDTASAYDFKRATRWPLLASARDLRADYTYPPGAVSQLFRWDAEGLNWQVRFPREGIGRAVVQLRAPLDLREWREGRLRFEVSPPEAVGRFALALVDGDAAPGHVLVDVMPPAQPGRSGGAATVQIPLRSFPADGVVLADSAAPGGGLAHGEFDWSDVREFRLQGAASDRGPLAIRRLWIER